MINIVDFLNNLDERLVNIFGDNSVTFLLFILSSLFTYYLHLKNSSKKRLVFYLYDNNIYRSSELGNLKISITFDNKNLDYICEGVIGIINMGNKVIKNKDISKKEKIRINIDDKYKFYDAELLVQNRKSFEVRISEITEKYIEIDFDFLELKDVFLIKFIHNCNLNELELLNKFNITGSIIEIPKIEYYGYDPTFRIRRYFYTLSAIGSFIFGTFISYLTYKLTSLNINWIYISIYLLFFISLLYILIRDYTKYIYICGNELIKCYNEKNGENLTFSIKSAFKEIIKNKN